MILSTSLLKRYTRFCRSPDHRPRPLDGDKYPPLRPNTIERNREAVELIQRFIVELPDEYTRGIVLMKYADGYTWAQIAQKIGGTSCEAIKQYVYSEIRRFNKRT